MTLAEKRKRLADLDSQLEDLHAQRDELEAEIETEEADLLRAAPASHHDLDGVDRRHEPQEPVYTRESWRERQEGRAA